MRFHLEYVALGMVMTSACGRSSPQVRRVCTLIGCESGTTVHLPTLPPSPFRIEVRSPGEDDVAYVYECGATTRCRQDVFFPNLIADHLFVVVSAAGRSRETEIIQIGYASSRPNGPHCEPDCRTAVITAQIPE